MGAVRALVHGPLARYDNGPGFFFWQTFWFAFRTLGRCPKPHKLFETSLIKNFYAASRFSYFPTQNSSNTRSTISSLTCSPVSADKASSASSTQTVTASQVMPESSACSPSSRLSSAR